MKNQIKYSALTFVIFAYSQVAFAQNTAALPTAADKSQEFNHLMQWVLLGVIGIMVATTAVISVRIMKMYQEIILVAIAKEQGRDVVNVIKEQAAKESWFDKAKFHLFATGAVAIEKEKDIMIEHPHDGIYELDNQLPPWWVSMFYITIVFAFVYIGYYHFFTTGKDQISQYKEEMRKGDIVKAQEAERQANAVNENSVVAVTEKARLDIGHEIFIGKCAACHGQKGEGGVGPNMTDDYWLHGGDIKSVFTVVKNGVPDKGMISWKEQLRAVDMQNVASYILTLKGTNPPNQKAPQGVLFTPEAGSTDTAKTTVKAGI